MPENKEEINIAIRSEEVQEILSHIPNWIIRWGITAILSAILLILVASWFIKYPDVVTARVTITTPIPPVNIVAKSSGAIELMVQDKSVVKKDEVLGVIENAATTNEVFQVIKKCEVFNYREFQNTSSFNEKLNMGSVQTVYLEFLKSLSDYQLFQDLDYYGEQSILLEKRIRQYEELTNSLRGQLAIQKRAVALAQEDYTMDSLLFTNDGGTRFEKNRTESVLLQAKNSYEASKTSLINNQIQIGQLKTQLADLQSKEAEQEKNLKKNIEQTLERLKSQLEVWKQQYVLVSPIEGKVSLSTYWSDNQYVSTGSEVMTVIPEETIAFGRVELPISGSGKVEEGQRVNIKLDNYPYQEYGMVTGRVKTKSLVPINNNYTLTLSLENGLKSSYNKELTFDREMQGTAEIITKDLRLIERVFNQFRTLLDTTS